MLIAIIITAVIMLFFMPTNYYSEGPGSAEPTKQFVKVNQQKDQHKGQFLLTTVGIRGPLTPVGVIYNYFQPFEDLVSQKELMGDEATDVYNQIQQYYMDSSINQAIAAAFTAAKKSYKTNYLGIYVMSILPQSPLVNVISLGDTITAIDGQHFSSADGFVKYIKGLKVNQKVTIDYQHQKQKKQITKKLIKLPDNQGVGLGITLTDHSEIETQPKVSIDAGDIGGPSAGLMFTLQVYNQLQNQDLTQGQKIAGTGTMSASGEVGPIGGIDKKVVIASQEGAKVFFAPDDKVTKAILKIDPNYQNNYTIAKKTAKKIQTDMKIIPVKTLNDAITYLKNDHR